MNFVNALVGGPTTTLPLPPGTQGQALTTVLHRVRSRIRFVPPEYLSPDDTDGYGELGRATLQMLDAVGRALRDGVIVADFDDEPVLSVIVDSHLDPQTERLVEIAVRQGAFIAIPDGASLGPMSSVRGKRFRLSYLFAASDRLPLHFARGASLVNMIGRVSDSDQDSSLPSLFDTASEPSIFA